MEDFNISSSQITASSEFDSIHVAGNARLNFNPGNVNMAGSWVAATNDVIQPWLQVDFQEKVTVIKIATQGRFIDTNPINPWYWHSHYQWVKTYSLSFSQNGVHFKAYEQFGTVKVILGFLFWDTESVYSAGFL